MFDVWRLPPLDWLPFQKNGVKSESNFLYMTLPGSLLDQFAGPRGYRRVELQLANSDRLVADVLEPEPESAVGRVEPVGPDRGDEAADGRRCLDRRGVGRSARRW